MRRSWSWRKLSVLICVAIATSVAAWAYVRSASLRHLSTNSLKSQFTESRDAIAGVRMVDLSDRAAVAEHIGTAVYSAMERLDPKNAKPITDSVVTFVTSRYAGTPEKYAEWRRHEGYLPIDLGELRAGWFLDEAYHVYTGKALAADAAWDEVHATVVGAQYAFEGGRLSIMGLSDSHEAVSVARKRVTRTDPIMPPVTGLPGKSLDSGGSMSIGAPWWRPPTDVDQIVDREGGAEVCVVGLIAEFGDGARRPVSMTFVWDPTSQRWWLMSPLTVGISKHGVIEGVRIEY